MKYLGKITDDKDLVTKEYVDTASNVVQTLTSGTKIGSVGGTDLYAPSGGGGGGTQNMWYATCPTAASTTKKVVTTTTGDFTLTTGNMLRVLFTSANSASAPTLEVDSQTATNVRVVTGASGAQYHWQAGETVDFVYNGTYFLMVDRAPATTTYYGPTKLSSSTSSTSTTLAATASAVKSAYDLATKANDLVTETYSSTSKSVAANNNYTDAVSITKSGYTPIAIVGWNTVQTSGANAAFFNIVRLYLSAASSGSGTVTIAAKNLATSAMTVYLTFYVLWKKD